VIDTEYLRVMQKDTGHELTVSQTQYDFAPEAFELLEDQDATDAGNNPLPPKYAAPSRPVSPTGSAVTPAVPPIGPVPPQKENS
jgi:hypothetical protein